MDIKLIRNTEDAVFKPINNGLVLQMVDDNYKFLDFIGKNCISLILLRMRGMKSHQKSRNII